MTRSINQRETNHKSPAGSLLRVRSTEENRNPALERHSISRWCSTRTFKLVTHRDLGESNCEFIMADRALREQHFTRYSPTHWSVYSNPIARQLRGIKWRTRCTDGNHWSVEPIHSRSLVCRLCESTCRCQLIRFL